MRIFINALSAVLGGGQTYLSNLLKHVPQEKDLQIFVLVQPLFKLIGLPKNVTLLEQGSVKNPLIRAVWEEIKMVALIKELKIDIFFSPGGLLPRLLPSNIFSVVTFQNMLPFDLVQRKKYPYGYRRLRDWLLRRALSSSMRRSDLIIFISKFAKNFIDCDLRLLKKNNIVIPHGIHPSFRFNPSALLPKLSRLPKSEYFLYVSFIDHYKAQLEVVRGFSLYRERGGLGSLVLVGPEYLPYGDLVRQEIIDLNLTDVVMMPGIINHEELPGAYQNSKVNIFASFTENCPNILLEMMASGRPVLVSSWGPMPEFGGDAVVYFDPEDPESFAGCLSSLVSNENQQECLAKAAMTLVENFTWEQASGNTWVTIIENYIERNN